MYHSDGFATIVEDISTPFTGASLISYINANGPVPCVGVAYMQDVHYPLYYTSLIVRDGVLFIRGVYYNGTNNFARTLLVDTDYLVDTVVEIGNAAVNLPDYYTKAQTDAAIQTAIGNIDIPTVPTKTSELTNDSNFVTETALETKGYLTAIPAEYVTDTELNNKGYLTAVPDTYALKTDIPDVSSFTTMAAVEAKGYQTASQVNTLIDEKIGSGGSSTQKDWKWTDINFMYSDVKHARFVLARGSADVATVDISGRSGDYIANSSYPMNYYIPDVFGILKTDNYSTYSSLAIKISYQNFYICAIGNDGENSVSENDISIVGYYYWG